MMTSVIPDGKTIRKQYYYQTLRSQPTTITVHLEWRLSKCEINTHRRECEQSKTTTDGQ